MIHAFLILTHQSPEKTFRQVKQLSAPNHFFVIHFDSKKLLDPADSYYKALLTDDHVRMIADRVNVQWGSTRIIDATLKLLNEALKIASVGYVHLLSGECMPVKSNKYFDHFFEEHNGKQFIDNFEMKETGSGPSFLRLDKYHLHAWFNPRSKATRDVIIKNLNSGLRKMQKGLKLVGIYRRWGKDMPTLHGGSQWWSLSAYAARYITDYVKTNPAYEARFAYSQIPDEIFFHTLVMNSPFKKDVVNKSLRFTNFQGAISSPHPVTMANLDAISKSDILIARKFTPESGELLAYLEQHIYNS
jgi:hypothetical protein